MRVYLRIIHIENGNNMKRIRLHKQFIGREIKSNKILLYHGSIMLFFWSLFDGLVSYVSPLVITEHGLSKSGMGVVIGSSSIAGAVFDILLSRYLKNTHYRRVYLFMFIVSFLQPVLLWHASTIWIYLAAMATWGLYYDLLNFGNYDFVSRTSEPSEHSSSFGLLNITKSLGYLLAPIIAGLVIGDRISVEPFFLMSLFLLIAAGSFIFMLFRRPKRQHEHIANITQTKPLNALREFHVWKTIGKALWPVLALVFAVNVIDAFFWTLGPLVAEELQLGILPGSIFITAYSLPTLLMGWFVGSIVKAYGKRYTALVSLGIGSLAFIFLGWVNNSFIQVGIVLAGSFFIATSWPAINSMVTEYITDSQKYEREIEGIVDLFTNIGYVIGPIIAGVLGDMLGNTEAFSILGAFIALLVIGVYLESPKLNRRHVK